MTAQDSVHPRACGEHSNSHRCRHNIRGSSPRLRGTLYFRFFSPPESRFIPALAGNTFIAVCCFMVLSVHPRACGEHIDREGQEPAYCGSSPRLRGTLMRVGRWSSQHRFIPALAGNTPWCAPFVGPSSVHPRACGEHPTADPSPRYQIGSSPRLRGTQR